VSVLNNDIITLFVQEGFSNKVSRIQMERMRKKLNTHRYVLGEAHEVSRHRLYTVQFVKCNEDTRLNC
jgi:hypothetical protein